MITKEKKAAAIKPVQTHAGDVGSPAAQIAILTARINELTEHMKLHKHDFMTRRGLISMVGRRKKLLRQLELSDFAQYKSVIEKLGLRK
jgi:small subunit ribosomal protein S15